MTMALPNLMPKSAATISSSCRSHIGEFCAVWSILMLLPSAGFAANPDPALRRSDQIDVRLLGVVSEDERSVLRIEWRSGLARIEEARSVQEMLDKLRRVETTMGEVSLLIRNMPVQKPGVAATVAVLPEAADSGSHDFRLALANIAAFTLVALWWFRRRKSANKAETSPAPAPEKLEPSATPPMAMPRIQIPPTAAPLTRAAAASSQPDLPPATVQKPDALLPSNRGGDTPRLEPAAFAELLLTAPAAGGAAIAEPVATTSFSPPGTKPAEEIPAAESMVIDFSLEEADPEIVARENARSQAQRTVSASPPPQTPQAANVEPTLQLAEIMLSMGLEQGAAQALLEYAEANPRHAVYHWLKLLGIYRSKGLQQEFTETADKLRKHFNIQAEEWGKPAAVGAPMLENFSRVSEHVQKIWSQPAECISYLRHLLEDNRDGARAGFPQSVAEEILFLVELLKDGQA